MPLTSITVADRLHADPPTIGGERSTREALDLVLASPYRCAAS